MKFNSYSIKARLLPAIFSIVFPIIIFNHFYVSVEFSKFVGEIAGSELASNLTISFVALYFLSELGRFFGKNIFEKNYFKKESFMPTTNFLMFLDSEYSSQHKKMIRKKIKSDFKIKLVSKKEEKANELESRKRIVEAMSQIRQKLHNNKFLFQHNIEYGAMRNVIGGSIVGIIFSSFNIYFFMCIKEVKLAVTISLVALCAYVLLVLFSKVIINFYGKNYARILYREYISM